MVGGFFFVLSILILTVSFGAKNTVIFYNNNNNDTAPFTAKPLGYIKRAKREIRKQWYV